MERGAKMKPNMEQQIENSRENIILENDPKIAQTTFTEIKKR